MAVPTPATTGRSPCATLFVGNLAWATKSHSLTAAFSPHGTVENAQVIVNKITGRSKGFGFVTFSSVHDAEVAHRFMENAHLDGRKLRVSFAKPQTKPAISRAAKLEELEGGSPPIQVLRSGKLQEDLLYLGTIEVFGGPTETDARGPPATDEEIAEILEARDLLDAKSEPPGQPVGKMDRESGHRWTNDHGVLVTRYTRHRLKCAFQLMGLKQLRAHDMAGNIFNAVFATLKADLWVPPEPPKVVVQRSPGKHPVASTRPVPAFDQLASRAAPKSPPNHPAEPQTPTSPVVQPADDGRSSGGVRFADECPRSPPRSAASSRESVIDLAGAAEDIVETTVCLSRRQFVALVRNEMAKNHHRKAHHLKDFDIACDINEHRNCMTVLLGGTSGCGKSTLASLLASRLGITTVLSTDFVRHMLRKIKGRDAAPILWASTYNAGACLDLPPDTPPDVQVLKGYDAQSSMLLENLSYVINSYESRKESLIIEGVHLSVENIALLMQRHPNCIPFLVCITNEDKHRERFAVRAKYMTLDGRHNRYIKFFRNIRCIQNNLVKKAREQFLIPQIDNTNVDRSVTAVHDILVKCMRMVYKGRPLYDASRGQATVLWQVYSQRIKESWSSKAMLRVIRGKISKGEVFRRYFEQKEQAEAKGELAEGDPTPTVDTSPNNTDTPCDNEKPPSETSSEEGEELARQEAVREAAEARRDEQDDGEDSASEPEFEPNKKSSRTLDNQSCLGSLGFTTMKEHSDKDSDTDTTTGSQHTQLSAVGAEDERTEQSSVVNVKGSNMADMDDCLSLPEEEVASEAASRRQSPTRREKLVEKAAGDKTDSSGCADKEATRTAADTNPPADLIPPRPDSGPQALEEEDSVLGIVLRSPTFSPRSCELFLQGSPAGAASPQSTGKTL